MGTVAGGRHQESFGRSLLAIAHVTDVLAPRRECRHRAKANHFCFNANSINGHYLLLAQFAFDWQKGELIPKSNRIVAPNERK